MCCQFKSEWTWGAGGLVSNFIALCLKGMETYSVASLICGLILCLVYLLKKKFYSLPFSLGVGVPSNSHQSIPWIKSWPPLHGLICL